MSKAFETKFAIASMHLIFQGSTTETLSCTVYTFQNFINIFSSSMKGLFSKPKGSKNL